MAQQHDDRKASGTMPGAVADTAGAHRAHPAAGVDAAALAQLVSLVPAIRLLTGLLIASVIILALYFGRSLLIPLALATLFGFLLDPVVSRLKRWGLPRLVAVLLVVVLALGAIAGAGAYLGNQLTGLSADLPTYQSTIRSKLRHLREKVSGPSAWDGAVTTFETLRSEIARTPPAPKPAARPAPGKSAGVSADAKADPVTRVEIVGTEPRPVQMVLEWVHRISEPAVTTGIVLLFVVLILLDRNDLRDRLLRLMGGNLHMATDAMDEASERIGHYLRMQLIVNLSYGVPMAIGLWWIGVPGAVLWGAVAAILRFVPYVGPLVSAVFPLALAFAVDPGWGMVLWTVGLILVLELISANVIEPWLYASSTGLSTLSIVLSATFWTALWGPVGLVLSTPLTVCLLVLGRYLPALKFIDVLLGSEPVLDAPQRLYQRLLADDVEEAVELAAANIDDAVPDEPSATEVAQSVTRFYDQIAVPALRLASENHIDSARAEHRLRLSRGMGELLAELAEQYPAAAADDAVRSRGRVHCVGARWEVDALASSMAAHVLALRGYETSQAAHPLSSALEAVDPEAWSGAQLLCLSVFSPQPLAQVRLICRRLHRRWPELRIVLALWNAPGIAPGEDLARRLGVVAIIDRMQDLALRVDRLLGGKDGHVPAPVAADDARRVASLRDSGVLAAAHTPLYRAAVQRAVNAFRVKYAQVSWVDADRVRAPGSLLFDGADGDEAGLPRAQAVCSYVVSENAEVVVEDTLRDPRFADNPALLASRIRFYAGVPLRDAAGVVLGSFCILDEQPRELGDDELELLDTMARELMQSLRDAPVSA